MDTAARNAHGVRTRESYLLHRVVRALSRKRFEAIVRSDAVAYACDNLFSDDPEARRFLLGKDRNLTADEIAVAVRILNRLSEMTGIDIPAKFAS